MPHIKGFVTCDTFTNNETGVVSPLHEISDIALTYSRDTKRYYSTEDSLYSLYTFHQEGVSVLEQVQANAVMSIVKGFVQYASVNRAVSKMMMIVTFMASYNAANAHMPVSEMVVGSLVDTGMVVGFDYASFTVGGLECSIWIHDLTFRGFYPDYEVQIVPGLKNLSLIVRNRTEMIEALAAFKLVEFNSRVEEAKKNQPTTHTRMLNIPYHAPGSSVVLDCYFAFNQWGTQGNYEFVLKLQLYEWLLAMGLESEFIEQIFPSILHVNEFFVTPRWSRKAIEAHVGEHGVLSQVSRAYSEVFDLDKFVKVYTDTDYLKQNTYHVPYDYNNVLLAVSNGFYTEEEVQDFMGVYGDLITVTSTHPDFARMSTKTQRLVGLLESMLSICDSTTAISFFSKIVQNRDYVFHTVIRKGVWYLSFFFEGHQWYMLPRYEHTRLEA